MIASQLRPGSSRLLKYLTINRGKVLPTTAAAINRNGAVRSISAEREKEYQELGYLDDQRLTLFDTLHEMQVRSCEIYAENDLFGTYNAEADCFKYISYSEFGEKVDRCRAVLKDLGTSRKAALTVISYNLLLISCFCCWAQVLKSSERLRLLVTTE